MIISLRWVSAPRSSVRPRLFRIRCPVTLAALLVGLLVIWDSGSLCAQEQRIAGRFIAVSDLHFDPFAAPELVNEFAAAQPGEWYADGLVPAEGGAGLTWKREYRFSELWQLPAIDAANLSLLSNRISSDERARAQWFSIYPVGRTANWNLPDGVTSLPAETFRAYDCAMKHVDAGEYRRCLCGAAQR